ncbi:RagB/SusD family nutrient uptake outer membrane protein [Dyadobacter sp. CY323]|uniref:RagB/SusD family nutrient uptake outer membrane protein n=1 Tax=Dyadobacter sp. CY323 TaxID=2907302 RepID=UPI001F4731DA|nr:RagB/SusD family nutrient uptake outer membrane protein [Dyadobacter sp. CY323]MCE6990197.1 RagB/SusD family nutrient uptake outer membrane protein [Dyadobacter sp. CY323]
MKNILTILIIGAAVLSSCKEEFLDLAPPTNLSSATYFKTEAQFDQALVGAYETLRGMVAAGAYMDEMRSDNTFFTYYAADRGPANWVEDIIMFRDNPQTTVTNGRYRNNYTGIARVNAIVDRIGAAGVPEPAKNRILGEALFLRAFYYFDLVQHYGGVPLHLKDVVSVDDAFLARSSVQQVYDQIVTDLNAAMPKLAEATVFPQSGRATKGAAKMLLAYAYMSKPEKEYAKAEAELLDITKMKYQLLTDYASVFNPTNKNSSESIFEIQFQEGNTGQQSDFIYTFLPKTTNASLLVGLPVSTLSRGGWNVPTEELVKSYETGDKRLPASISVIQGTQTGDNFTYEVEKNVVGYTPQAGKTYRYFIKKFLNPPYQREFNTNDNWPVFRYAGAMLLLAECLVQQGKAASALPYINAVRARAGLPALTTATAENVANETRHELAFENHRYTDLIRTGKAIPVLTAKGNEMKRLYTFVPANAFEVTESRLVYPIPFRELQLNNQLEQNLGY